MFKHWLFMQLITSCYMIAKNLSKTPRQKLAKNPMRQKSAWITQKLLTIH